MKFPIIVEDKKKRRLKIIIVFSILIIIPEAILFYPEDENTFVINTLFAIPSILWTIALIYSNLCIFAYKETGKLSLIDDKIIFGNYALPLEKLKIMVVKYENYRGIWIRLNITQGVDNEIFILTNDDTQYRFNILLRDKESFILLKKFILILIEKNVNIHFYVKGKRIYPKK